MRPESTGGAKVVDPTNIGWGSSKLPNHACPKSPRPNFEQRWSCMHGSFILMKCTYQFHVIDFVRARPAAAGARAIFRIMRAWQIFDEFVHTQCKIVHTVRKIVHTQCTYTQFYNFFLTILSEHHTAVPIKYDDGWRGTSVHDASSKGFSMCEI